jgi:HAD superfamily hydrolase (TIGR01509 family)
LRVVLIDGKGESLMTRSLEAVVFDMDGLMIDTEKTYKEGWLLGANALNVELPGTFISDAAGRSIDDNIKALQQLTNDLSIVMSIRKIREDYFYQNLANGKIPLKPYLKELIEVLKANQIKTAVATSSYKNRVSRVFEHYHMTSWFDVVITGDEVANVKPHPELYLTALEMLGVDHQSALVLEDSITGARAANNAKIPFIIVPDSSSEQAVEIPADFRHIETIAPSLENVAHWLIEKNLLKRCNQEEYR